MFTLSEADDYHNKEDCAQTSSDIQADGVFRKGVNHSGWLITNSQELGNAERRWISDFEHVPPWLARAFNEDIFSFNRESMPLWSQMKLDAPDCFDGVEYAADILRIYSDREHWQRQIKRQNQMGATLAVLDSQEIGEKYPALKNAVDAKEIAGGIEVEGFTVNIHKFMARMLNYLEQKNVHIVWDSRVGAVHRNEAGVVSGLDVDGQTFTADHYVVSTGVYGNDLLKGFRSSQKVHGILGLWLRVPNLEPALRNSLKIARRGHAAEDSNVTIATDNDGREMLIVGSGYGYTGTLSSEIQPALLEELFLAVEDTAKRFFPRSYEMASSQNMLHESRRYCIRPWTASCLGLFEIVEAEHDGLAIVTGGHNTGGFAQAPSVAQAVVSALVGKSHPMHQNYHPDRLDAFLSNRSGGLHRTADKKVPPTKPPPKAAQAGTMAGSRPKINAAQLDGGVQ